METLKKSALFLTILVAMVACNEDLVKNTSPQSPTLLVTSKSKSIKIGEPVLFTALTSNNSTTEWTISPDSKAIVTSDANKAMVRFMSSGSYTVSGVSGSAKVSSVVSVSDSVYVPDVKGSSIISFSAGDQLNITAVRRDTVTTSSTIPYLEFFVKTTNNYNCLGSFLEPERTYPSVGLNGIILNFKNISIPTGCSSGSGKATGYFNFFSGVKDFTIVFNNKTYTGTIVQDGGKFTIKWPYTSGVVISPTSL